MNGTQLRSSARRLRRTLPSLGLAAAATVLAACSSQASAGTGSAAGTNPGSATSGTGTGAGAGTGSGSTGSGSTGGTGSGGSAASGTAGTAAGAAAGAGTNTSTGAGQVSLNPASGPANSRPTWSTAAACPAGHQGSAVFREVHADGTTNSISEATNQAARPFSGTLQGTMSQIEQAGGIKNGGTQQFVVICFAHPSGIGSMVRAMSVYVTYSKDGGSYSTSATKPTGA